MELLVTVALMSILTGVAVVSVKRQDISQAKKDLKRSSMLFETKVANCVSSSGGWTVTKPDGTTFEPCYDTVQADNFTKLNYNCPAKATCKLHKNNLAFCLSIERTISNKKYQVITRLKKDSPAFKPHIVCGEVTSFLDITDIKYCSRSFKLKDSAGALQTVSGKTTLHGLMGEGQVCPW